MTTAHQYMRSSDPSVIAAVQTREAEYAAWEDQLFQWASDFTGIPREDLGLPIFGWRGDKLTFSGFHPHQVKDVELPGAWTKDPVRPYKSNPLYADFRARGHYKARPIPGRKTILIGEGMIGAGTVFAHQCVAYSGVGFIPTSDAHPDQDLWEEIPASVLYQAVEEVNAARRG